MRCASGDGSAGAVAMVITDRPLATGTRCSLPLRVVIVLKIVVGHERPRNEFWRIGVELALVLQGKIKLELSLSQFTSVLKFISIFLAKLPKLIYLNTKISIG